MQDVVKLLLMLAILVVAVLLARRVLLFLRNLMRPVVKPVRAVVRPVEEAMLNHVDQSLRDAGLDGAANASQKLVGLAREMESRVGAHLDKVEAGIKAKREKNEPSA